MTKIERRQLTAHRDTCAEEKVACNGADLGCSITTPRHSLQDHQAECPFVKGRPVILVLQQQIQQQLARLERLEKQLQGHKPGKEIENLQQRLAPGVWHCRKMG